MLLPKVVLDTNIFVSGFINPNGLPSKILELWMKGRLKIVISAPLLEEIIDVLHRPRIKQRYELSNESIEKFIEIIAENTECVTPKGKLSLCRDPDDNLVLETALLGNAEYLVTRDDDMKRDTDLMARMREHNIKVVSVNEFLANLK